MISIVEVTKNVGQTAHQQYLDVWEIKTQVAENDGVWTPEIQTKILKNMEEMASTLSLLARSLSHFLDPNDTKTAL